MSDLQQLISMLPPGKITEISGPNESAKTTLALKIVKAMQEESKSVFYIDADFKANIPYFDKHINSDIIYYCLHNKPDEILNILQPIQKNHLLDFLVVDSISNMNGSTREIKTFITKLSQIIYRAKCPCIVINQLRYFNGQDVPMYDDILNMYSSLRLNTEMVDDNINITVRRCKQSVYTNSFLIAL